ncbi:NAD dependent epimerase/dehydratase [Legionella busanensis]|uniref:NAD dependent epimerase/dehydratase n=1 Tax=Legionella busanensis TaxID=190655 RepID=A0A378JK40_9GAMM|nr:FAD-dependent monooxygenase [Legionella busanensis]STX51595.1 NAD dependent epimerase/dehydratase [Legionella busanensis]
MTKNVDIIIVGAGIGGLTTAIACNKAGFSTLIVEKESQPSEIGAGIWLAPNALEIYEELNLTINLFDLGFAIKQIKLDSTYSGSLRTLTLDKYKFNILAIHRGRLQKYLIDQIVPTDIYFGKRITSIEQNETGVNVQLNTGEILSGKILVGADGLHSQVRDLFFQKNVLRYSGSSSFRGIVSLTTPAGSPDYTSYEIWAPGCKFGYSFISNHEKYWYISFKSKSGNYFHKDEVYNTALAITSKFFVNHINLIEQTYPSNIIQTDISDLLPLKAWHNNRICLLGDAAHATTPHLGQGAAQAIEDAMALALSLKKLGLNSWALKNYHNIRYKKAEYLVRKAKIYDNISEWHYPVLQALRDTLIKTTPRFFINKTTDKVFLPVIK